MNGYAQVQEYLLLQKWIDKIRPDLIIVVVYIRNDFGENVGTGWIYPGPFASWGGVDSTLEINLPAPARTAATSGSHWKLYRESHLYRLIDRELYALTDKLSRANTTEFMASSNTPQETYLCRREMSEHTELMYRTMEELILKIATYVGERRVPLVFALAPSFVQVDERLWSSTFREFGEREENHVRSPPNDRLMHIAASRNLLMIDLLPILTIEAKKGRTLYNLKEQHWTSEGNRIVADSLLTYLRTKSLIE